MTTDYEKTERILYTRGSGTSLQNKLIAVMIKTEDELLKERIKDILPVEFNMKFDRKNGRPQKTGSFILSQSVKTLVAYIEEMKARNQPQWQILAKRHGWQPPRD